MRVVRLKAVECTPEIIEIDGTLESLQKEVGGSIQVVYPFTDPVAIICNDEGKLEQLPPSAGISYGDGYLDFFAGNILIVGLGEENFTSLNPPLLEKYASEGFWYRRILSIGEYLVPCCFATIGGE